MTYESASQCFINREFARAAELLSHDFQPNLKSWMLYLALCERSFIEDYTSRWNEQNHERKTLKRAILRGTIWTQMKHSWREIQSNVPPTLVTTSMILSSRYKADPEPIIAFMEEYIALRDVPQEVIDIFIVSILSELHNDFIYARKLVQSALYESSPQKQQQLIDKIRDCEQKLIDEQQLAVELQNERIEEAKEEQRKLQLPKDESDTTDPEKSRINPSDSELIRNSEMSRAMEQNDKKMRNYQRINLTEFWKDWIRGILRGQGVYNAVVLFLTILALLKNSRSREGLRDCAAWLYRAGKVGLDMALRVTYL